MGIPLYGRSFTLASESQNDINAPARGPGTRGPITKEGGYLAYFEICYGIKQGGWTIKDRNGDRRQNQNFDEAHSPYAFKNKEWVSYDDIKSIKRKVI